MPDEYILRSIAIAKLTALEVTDPFATIADAKRVLADMAAADVAPVVRCRDCEYARDLGFKFGSLVHESWFCIYNGPHTTGANDFCSHGQKREKGEIEDDP